MILLALGTVAAAEKDNRDRQEGASSQRPTPLEIIENKTQVHARVHQSIDLRVTVFAVTIIAILGQSIKDGRTLFPQWLMILIAVVGLLGLFCVSIAAFISSRNMREAESVDQIKKHAESDDPLDVAAIQLHSMQKITRRKSRSANLALILMVVDAALFCLGMAM